jgi:enterochelin esterase-like enzyme
VAVFIAVGTLCVWQGNVLLARSAQGHARQEIWAVPAQYDAPDCAQPGTVEELLYDTKAYGTDSRTVRKRAMVYLPYGYDADKQYNILYLMHGTGDDENYWLVTHPENKHMLDQMIAQGQIEPLIVVTPTFYTEDDCAENLDRLTYAFADELRNDLMVAVESKYSTYAESCDAAGFTASRDHRAFAGLSRGAVTACHAALCGSLDYFSWFGLFSAFRTEEQYLTEHMQAPAVADLPIHYLYMTSGNFDFALPGQIPGYELLLRIEPRLQHGVNADFDIYPMRYHSADNWHLALYNCLQRIF